METTGNGRDGVDHQVEQLFCEASTALGRVLDERQIHAVQLSIQLFAYLVACLDFDAVTPGDVIRMLKVYSRGIGNAKSTL
jgi:hypothetical protein